LCNAHHDNRKEERGCSNQDLIGAQTTCLYAAINDG